MNVKQFDPTAIESMKISDKAADKIKSLLNEEDNQELMLRVFVTGGGCSGFQYGFTFEDNVDDDDTIIEKNNIKVIIDPMSLQYLEGSIVDLKEELLGSQFIIENPNATTTCGCGSSFSV